MFINLVYDAAAQAAPPAFRATMQQAATMLQSMFTDNITININIDYSGTGGGAAAGPDNGLFESYQSVYNYLTQRASPGDTTFTGLPNATSINGQSQVTVWNAQLKLMGLLSPNDAATDDASASFATDISSNLLLGVALHELTHALGRINDGPQPDIFDFFRYTSQGNRFFSNSIPASAAYFSLNGGLTKWADYGINSDPADNLNNALTLEDAFNEFYDGNTLQYLTPYDLEQLDALGYHLKSNAPAVNNYDFNGQNSGDVLLQNASGQTIYANMFGGTFQGWVGLTSAPGWTVEGQGKISGGTCSDVVAENASGQIQYGTVVNGSFSNWVSVANTPGFNVVGVGDINGDHHADIVVQSHNTGVIDYANMANGTFTNWVGLQSAPGWSVVAVADINFDGFSDIVIQNSGGSIAYANMDNGVFAGWVGLAGTPGWKVVGAGGIERDGYADVVVQNQSTGQIAYADMDKGVFNNWVGVGSTPGWNVIAVEDVIGNGFYDIVVQNPSTGQLAYANMTAGTLQGWVGVSSAPGYTGATGPAIGGRTVPMPASTLGMATTHGLSISDSAQQLTNLLVQGMAAFGGTAAASDISPAQPSVALLADLLHAGGHVELAA